MKISKHVHSCLLIANEGNVFLIDPGHYTQELHALDISSLSQLDYLIITHEHMDHFSLPMVKKLVEKFPQVKIITTSSLVKQLAENNIKAKNVGDENITVEIVPHEKVWGVNPPENIKVTIVNKLTHPGDSHTFDKTAEVLALPVTAPWGSTTAALDLAVKIKPKIVIPIHDAMWTDNARRSVYQWIKSYLDQKGIDFKAVETGEIIEV